MAMVDIARLRILVDMDSGGVVRGAATGTAAIAGFERGTTQALSRITSSFKNLTVAQKGLIGIGASAVLVGTALNAVVGPAIAFESAFAGVEKTVDGTPAQLSAIRDGLLELSAVIPTTADDLAGIAANAGQLGVAAPKILEFTEVVAGLGETTDLSFDSAAQSLARFINVTGGGATITQLGDAIVDLGNNSATTESQILTFAQRLASAFTVAGATESEILALGASFSSLGIEAEAGASALNKTITVIADAAKLGGRELQVLADTSGLTSTEFAKLAQATPVEAMLAFGRGLGRVSESGRSITPILEQLELGGLRTTRVLQLLALGSDQVAEALAISANQFENGGALAEEAGKRYETTAARIEILQNRLRGLAIDLGTPALSTFAAGADTAGDAVEGLADIIAGLTSEASEAFRNLASAVSIFYDVLGEPAVEIAVAALIGLVEVVAALLAAFNELGPLGPVVLGGIIIAFRQLSGSLAATSTSLATTSAAVASVGTSGAASTTSITALAVSVANLVALLTSLAAASAATTATTSTTTAAMAGLALAAGSAATSVVALGTATVGFNSAMIALGPVATANTAALTSTTTATAALTVGSTTAAAGTSRLGLAATATTGALGRLAVAGVGAGRSLLALAAPVAPLAAIVGTLALVGAAFADANAKASEFAGTLRTDLDESIAGGSYEDLIGSTQRLVEEQARLEAAVDSSSTSLSLGGRNIRDFGGFMSVLGGILPGVGSAVLDNERALNALDEILNDINVDRFSNRIQVAANVLGISEDNILSQARALGVLDELLSGTSEEYREARDAIAAATEEQARLSDETGILLDKILSGTASFEDYSSALGVTTAELGVLANQLDGVKVEDLLDPDKAVQSFDAIEALLGSYGALADQVGLTTTEFISQIAAVDALSASHSALRKTVDAAAGSLALIEEQQRITQEATVAFDEALDAIGETDGLDAAAAAMRTLSLEFAASGVSAEAAAVKQEELYLSFLRAAEGAGIAEDEAIAVAIALGLVPEAVLAEITVEGEQAKGEARAVERALEQTERSYRARLEADPTGLLKAIDEADISLDLFTSQRYLAILRADGLDAAEAIEQAEQDAREYANAEYIAILDANGIDGAEQIAKLERGARLWADQRYLALLEVDGLDAAEEIGVTRAEAEAYAAGDYSAALGVEGDEQSAVLIQALTDAAQRYGDDEYLAILEAEGLTAVEKIKEVRDLAREYGDDVYLALLQALDDGATDIIDATRIAALTFSDGDYEAFLRANGVNADDAIDLTAERAQAFRDDDYNAVLTATDNASATIARARSQAFGFADPTIDTNFTGAEIPLGGPPRGSRSSPYTATLSVVDEATRVIQQANEERDRFKSKSITLSATYRTFGRPPGFESGGITIPRSAPPVRTGTGALVFEQGGITDSARSSTLAMSRMAVGQYTDGGLAGALRQGVATPSHTADIFSPVTPFRIMSEPPTGGETFIPHQGDRNRNRNIWETHGRMFGYMQEGGIMRHLHAFQNGGLTAGGGGGGGGTSVAVNAPITIDLANLPEGADLSTVSNEIQRQIRTAFNDLGRSILNTP